MISSWFASQTGSGPAVVGNQKTFGCVPGLASSLMQAVVDPAYDIVRQGHARQADGGAQGQQYK
jgi:hypothetical protein